MSKIGPGNQATHPTEEVVREVVGQIVRATPSVALVIGALAAYLDGPPAVVALIAFLGVLHLVPVVQRRLPEAPLAVVAAWYSLLAVTISLLALSPQTFPIVGVAAPMVILGSRVVERDRTRRLLLAVVVIIIGLGWGVGGASVDRLWAVLLLPLLAIGSENLGAVHRSMQKTSEACVQELAADRSMILRLYQIASSTRGSTSLDEALPDLLGSIADAVGARTCAFATYDLESQSVRLNGPLWADGVVARVDRGASVGVVDGSFCDRVLRSSRAVRFDRRTAGPMGRILDDVGVESGLVTPIRLEGLASGLIVVGDPVSGWFEPEMLGVLTDIAAPAALVLAQVARYEAAALLAERLREVAEMKTDLVAMVTHELRTPLTSVIGSLDIMKRLDPVENADLVEELMTTANRQAYRLKRLIDDLLTVSRFDRGLVRPKPEPVGLSEAVAQALWVVGDVPATIEVADGLSAVADRDHFQQILVNLVENAAKFADGSSIEIGAGRLDNGDVVVAVVDHGPGIAHADRERVFDRFVQLTDGPRSNGSGLGLAIVKMLTVQMGGTVEVFDTPGGGATFAVRLPGVGSRRARSAA